MGRIRSNIIFRAPKTATCRAVKVEMLRAKLAEAEGAKIEIDTSRLLDILDKRYSGDWQLPPGYD